MADGTSQSAERNSARLILGISPASICLMSHICFVRHAQASLFEADYDQLSERGEIQARMLGEYIARQGLQFDEVFVGPRRRHAHTAQLVVATAEGRLPEAVSISELDEHQVDRLATVHVDEIGRQFPDVAAFHSAFQSANGLEDRQRAFARLFEGVARLWMGNRCPTNGVEPWSEFRHRVDEAIGRILAGGQGGRGRRVLVVTSAGPLVVALKRALGCPDETALGLGWRIWNCSLTEFVFSGNRFTLDRFNALPHLDDRSMWTYR
jgi:broad specificity phosphatase PhoE